MIVCLIVWFLASVGAFIGLCWWCSTGPAQALTARQALERDVHTGPPLWRTMFTSALAGVYYH